MNKLYCKSIAYSLKIALLLLVVNLLILFLITYNLNPKKFNLNTPEKLLVFATHQDDGVICSAGVTMQNNKNGGKTLIVYLTKSNEKIVLLPEKEAKEAWGLIDTIDIKLKFLNFTSTNRIWSDSKIDSARNSILSIVNSYDPTLIIYPLKENGNIEHDILSSMVAKVLASYPDIKSLKATEYNPYYLIEESPVKFFWFLTRLFPYIPYQEKNYGLFVNNQIQLDMTNKELDQKIQMLLTFKSQKDIIPISQFGYPDLFENTNQLPKGAIKFIGKSFSLYTIIIFSLFLITCFLAGGYLYVKIGKYRTYYWVLFIIFILHIIIIQGLRGVIEDGIFIIVFYSGFLLSFLFESKFQSKMEL